MSTLAADVSPIAEQTYDALVMEGAPRYIRHEGGTSSGKTRNIAHALIRLLTEVRERLTIVRNSGPVLKRSVQVDVDAALDASGVKVKRNLADNTYTFPNGSLIEMLSLDGAAGEQKAKGPRRGILWSNEANEIPEAVFDQLDLRTRRAVIMDYNPAMEDDHYIFARFDEMPESECITFRSTYEHNPFLDPAIVRKIETLKDTDPYAWQVYGMGERGRPAYACLPFVHAMNQEPDAADSVLGLDFGFHDPMSLVRVIRKDGEPRARLFVWALVHERLMTTGDLIKRLPDFGVTPYEPIWCDSAEADRIEEIKRAGYNARPVVKGAGSVKAGVDWLKRHDIYVGGPAGSVARSEMKRYRNKEVRGALVDDPLDKDNHAADALRYAAHSAWAHAVDHSSAF